MITSDPHEGEPTTELDPALWLEFVSLEEEAARVSKRLAEVKEQLILSLGDAHAGMFRDRKVVTFRPQKRYAEAQLRARYPDLTQHFVTHRVVEELDLTRFGVAHPEILEQFRVRAFKIARQ